MEPYSILSVWFNGNRVEITVEDMNEGKTYRVSIKGDRLIGFINSKAIDAILIADLEDDYKKEEEEENSEI